MFNYDLKKKITDYGIVFLNLLYFVFIFLLYLIRNQYLILGNIRKRIKNN